MILEQIALGDKDVYSSSKIGSYDKCPLQYYLNYIKKIKVDEYEDPEITTLGKIYHKIAELYQDGMDIEALAKESFEKYDLSFSNKNKKTMENIENIKVYKDKIFDRKKSGEIIFIEEEKDIRFDFGAYSVRGYIDLLYADQYGYHIIDYKTSQTQGDDRHIRQMLLYILMVKETIAKDMDISHITSRVFYVKLGKLSKIFMMNPHTYDIFKYSLYDKIANIRSSHKFPAKPTFMCSWCQYNHTENCPLTLQ